MKTIQKISLVSTVAFCFFTLFLFAASSGYSATVAEVEEHLMCTCKDNCGKMLKNCTCKHSDEMRNTISLKLKDGLTKDDILAFYINQYGEKVLSAPTKKGFNLVAWFTPAIAIILGGIAIRLVVAKWVKKREEIKTETAQNVYASKESNEKYLSQLKKELNDFDA